MKGLLTPKTIALVLLALALAASLWYALVENPKVAKLDTTYTFT
ncbi:hypothetical protein [Fibrella forsythiae]|nr:hypothetical protein [Fibrella forsythiae]